MRRCESAAFHGHGRLLGAPDPQAFWKGFSTGSNASASIGGHEGRNEALCELVCKCRSRAHSC